jgi:hypothetical protein
MNKAATIVSIAGICLLIAIKIDLFNALFMLFLVGIIPGTHIVIPASVMLLILTTTICLVLLALTGEAIRSLVVRHFAASKTGKSHLPKRRFSQI